MAFVRKGSIQRKLTLVIFFASVLGLSLTCLAFELYERAMIRSAMTSELSAHAEMLGGKIWLESEVGRGSEFHFTARLGLAHAKPAEPGALAPMVNLSGVKVVVVDDNRTNRRILEGMLKRWEMNVASVEGAEEALEQLCAALAMGEPFELILTDMHMPKMDGFALVEQIRQRPELSTATIMMLTSAGHRGDAARCEELGVSAYLLKPGRRDSVDHAILVARFAGAFGFVARPARGRQSREPAAGGATPGKEGPHRGGSRQRA